MKIEIELENISKVVEQAVKDNTGDVIQEYVKKKTEEILDANYKDMIEKEVTKTIKECINKYIECYQIQVGNPFDGKEMEVYTPYEYINHKIGEVFTNGAFIKEEKDYYGGKTRKSVSFEEYVKSQFNYEDMIKKHFNTFTRDLKSEVQTILTDEYNKATRNAISDVVLDTIMENEKFKNISNNIKRLGD